MAINPTYDNALSIAIPYYTKKFTDAVTSNSPLLAALRHLGGILTTGGAREVIMPLRLASGTPQIVDDPMTVSKDTRDNSLTAANYPWAETYSPLIIPKKELNQLGNNAEGLDQYVQAKIKGVISDTGILINGKLFGAAQAPTSIAIGSLLGAINIKSVAYGIPAGQDNWASHVYETAGEMTQDLILSYMAQIFAENGQMPNLIVTTPGLWSKLASLAQVSQKVDTSSAKPDSFGVGFMKFYFYGALVICDALCPAGTMFMINTENLKLAINKEVEVTEIPAKEPIRFWRFTQFCQLCIDNRKAHCVITGLT